jgi:hypothetical protein
MAEVVTPVTYYLEIHISDLARPPNILSREFLRISQSLQENVGMYLSLLASAGIFLSPYGKMPGCSCLYWQVQEYSSVSAGIYQDIPRDCGILASFYINSSSLLTKLHIPFDAGGCSRR